MVVNSGASLSLVRDGSGRPLLSATFVVSRTPSPDERLGDLVEYATLSVDLRAEAGGELPRWVDFEVLGQPASRVRADGPFGRGTVGLNLSREEAVGLLRAIVAGTGGPLLRSTIHLDEGDVDVEVPLGELLGAEIGGESAWLHITAPGLGGLVDVPPVRRPRAAPSGLNNVVMLQGSRPVPMQMAVRPDLHRPPPFIPTQPRVPVQIPTHVFTPLPPVAEPGGPVLVDAATLMTDRADASLRWYVPIWDFDAPPRGATSEDATFLFRVRSDGHTSDGREAIVATIRFRLRETMSAAARAAAAGFAPEKVRPVALEDLRVSLAVPFRDPGEAERVEFHPAASITRTGAVLEATFELRDQWARMAYGCFSSAGFQSRPAQLVVSATHRGWRSEPWSRVLGGTKALGLRGAAGILKRPAIAQLAQNRISVLGRPVLLDAEHLAPLLQRRWVSGQATVTLPPVDVFVDCGISGELYRRVEGAQETAIGCQSAFSLGQGDPRTHEAVEVAAAGKWAKVLRSLTRPRVFLVVAGTHCVGRYGPDAGERAYTPTLLLSSTLDADDPGNISCVLAAGLQPDLPPDVRAAITDELEASEGGSVQLETPWEAGLSPTLTWAVPQTVQVEAVASDTGFAVLLDTDIPGFLALQNLLRTCGVSGSARWKLPDGTEVISTLRLALDHITGPEPGVIQITGNGTLRQLTNRLARSVAVDEVRAGRRVLATVGRILQPAEVVDVTLSEDAADPVVAFTVEPGAETLEEVRAYVEDLQLKLTLVAETAVGAGNSAAVGVHLADDGDIRTVTLDARHRQADVVFTLPLTRYLSNPALEVAVEGIGVPSATFTWSVRDQGVLIPIPVAHA